MNPECEDCPHKGQCDMQCWNPYNPYWVPDNFVSGDDEE